MEEAGPEAESVASLAERRNDVIVGSGDKKRRRWLAATAVVAVALVAGGLYWKRSQKTTARFTEKDSIVLTDFDNKTRDNVFDDTLKTALSISLKQSPFLNVLSDERVAGILQLMERPADIRLTPAVAREVCLRANATAYIAGSIAPLGNSYVVGLKAIGCATGDVLAQEQGTATAKEEVLNSLGKAATRLRMQLGESLNSVQKFDVPLIQATTSSLEALKEYSLAASIWRKKGIAAALPHMQRTVQLDPNFTMAYNQLSFYYYSVAELGRAREYDIKAYRLRENASELERLWVTAAYYQNVTGEQDKAAQTFQEMIDKYPRHTDGFAGLSAIYEMQGEYEKALETTPRAQGLGPEDLGGYEALASCLIAVGRLAEAGQVIREAQAHRLDDFLNHTLLYALAFLAADSSAMAEQQKWFEGKPEYENLGLSLASDTEAYGGHLGKAEGLTGQSVDSAVRADSKESGAIWLENAALREAAFGRAGQARQAATAGLQLAPASQGIEVEAALAFAMAGDMRRADSLARDLKERYPLDAQVQALWLPAIQAQTALDRKNPAGALEDLRAVVPPLALGQIMFVNNISCLYPTYVRGQAYLAAGQGRAAAAEFQEILNHRGIVWNCWTGALAHLGLARANALEVRASKGADSDAAHVRALAAYQDFLTLWKDADPDIPIYKQANAEYAKLK